MLILGGLIIFISLIVFCILRGEGVISGGEILFTLLVFMGIAFMIADSFTSKSAKYIITDQRVSNKYTINNREIFFTKPQQITTYEKDCSSWMVLKDEYKYIIIGEVK